MKALALAFVLLCAAPAAAQQPVGMFDCGDGDLPAWVQFCNIADWVADAEFRAAAQRSEATGLKWVLSLAYAEDPTVPILAHAQRVLDRLRDTGLLPNVVAFSLSEEWYERCAHGEFAAYGLPAGSPACVPIVRDWLGRQHLTAKTVLGLPVIWIATAAGPPSGDVMPIPPHVNYVALDTYIPEGSTFEAHVAPIFAYAERAIAGTSMRLVQIPPWFSAPGWETPTTADLRQYAAWAARPLWAATWGFTWLDRVSLGMRGLAGLHDMRADVLALRGR